MNNEDFTIPRSSAPEGKATRLPRRTVLKWFAAAGAALPLPEFTTAASAAPPATQGYGSDPDLARLYQPGDFWPLTFSPSQRKTATAFADLILPADPLGPSASQVRVPDYIDEWVSAPYSLQQNDRAVILPGLDWLEAESAKRFQKDFSAITEAQQRAICDDICWPPDAKAAFKKAAAFFVKFRSLAASAYYGTEAGWKALGYIGNISMATFDGPPQEVLDKLGVEQTVK